MDHSIQNAGNLFSVAFGTSEKGVHNYADVKASATNRYTAFFHSMLESGVYLPPSAFEPGLSLPPTTMRRWTASSRPCRPPRYAAAAA